MAKSRVEIAPKLELNPESFSKFQNYLESYNITDDKDRYLHWSQLKWRLPRENAHDIWLAIRFKRMLQMKQLSLRDPNGLAFSYCIPQPMEAKLHQVIKIAGGSTAVIAGSALSASQQSRFLVSSLLMEEAISSAQLEGASTTREVAKKMLAEERPPTTEDERMILNNFLLLHLADKNAQEPLTLDLILNLHQVATQHTTSNQVIPGEMRDSDDIFVYDGNGDIAYQPPSYQTLPKRLQDLCDFANDEHSGSNQTLFIPPVIKAIILHFMLSYEHPFRDGNGRTARALFYWYMIKSGYNLFKYVSISKLLKEQPKEYGLTYLYSETDNNDLTYFIDFQLDIILRAFNELEHYLEQKSREFNSLVGLLEQSKFGPLLNFMQKDIIKKAAKTPGRYFSVKEVAADYDISANTARKNLNQLVAYKLLLPTQDGRTQYYITPADLHQRLLSH